MILFCMLGLEWRGIGLHDEYRAAHCRLIDLVSGTDSGVTIMTLKITASEHESFLQAGLGGVAGFLVMTSLMLPEFRSGMREGNNDK